MEKKLLDSVLARIQNGAVRVTYWDGTEKTYGNGKPLVHVSVNTPKAVRKIMRQGNLGFGESYMDGLIDIDGPLDQILRLSNDNKPTSRLLSKVRVPRPRNVNVKSTQRRQIAHHYDIGNDFYKLWLDESMTYSCAYFKTDKDTLEQAQAQKVDHLLRKLQLKKGMTLLDIGCGWGTLMITAAKKYGVSGVGITLSKNQQKHATAAAKKAGVSKLVQFKLMNYQDLAETGEQFDRIISVGMFEHVGKGNHAKYFAAVDKMLKSGGLSVLHTISHTHETASDPWIVKYIFPGGYIPSVRETVAHLPKHDFQLYDYENLRIHYAMTLDEWWRRFERHKEKVIKMYDERFYRMWRLYLASSSAAFRYGDLNLSQFVFVKGVDNELPLTREFLYKK
jgi:cyclopropane-fatty-acyl-phospholipid synthase